MGKRNRERVARIRSGEEEPRCLSADRRKALRDEMQRVMKNMKGGKKCTNTESKPE